MARLLVRAVANVMGLRRGDVGDVETGSTHVDAMIDRGYLEVIEYLPDPEPPKAAPFARNPVEAKEVPLPDEVPAEKPKPRKRTTTRKKKADGDSSDSSDSGSTAGRRRSTSSRRSAGDAGDGQDSREGHGSGSGEDGKSTGSDADEQEGSEA